METRRNTLSSMKICRFCLCQGDTLTSLYEKCRAPRNSVTLPLKILSCVSVEVFPSDKMPTYICSRCKFFMDLSYDFKHMCRQADEHTLQYIQNGMPLTSMTWSQTLLKLFRLANKSPEVALMKTVVEGGATVHVTAQESESDDEDEENVYNVKIGDGSDEGSKSTRVKVITSADKQDKGKHKRGKGFTTASKLSRHVRTHAGDRSYPCKYCNKSFTKSHHYTRHLRLKHRETIRTCRGPFGESDQFRCEQCEDSFATQDELIYHSAIHATQNLICPLCQEKFEDVDAVTAHIKSHVNGTEFMCDLCELVFTSKEKLDNHLTIAHDDEMRSVPEIGLDESSMEMEVDDDEDDAEIRVKEEDDHMVVEIKKADEFMLLNTQAEADDKIDNTNSEDSEPEVTFTELPNIDNTISITRKVSRKVSPENVSIVTLGGATIIKASAVQPKNTVKADSQQTASIVRKAEEVKKKVTHLPVSEQSAEKKEKSERTNNNKIENSNSVGASDKSLRLLEKELQELKRTNTRSETLKTPAKPIETLRNRRAQIHASTPKIRATAVEEKKIQVAAKSPALEKKTSERRVVTKENKEPKETKEMKANNVSAKEEKDNKEKDVKEKEVKEKDVKEKDVKEKDVKEKDVKEKDFKEKDVKEKEVKEKETSSKNVVKNGNNEKIHPDEGIRRSTRPSKIKDYAKMIRDRSQDSEDNDDSDDADDEEYKEIEKSIEARPKARRASAKTPVPKSTPSPAAAPRKRGRPRKEPAVAPKIRKEETEDDDVIEVAATIESEKDNKSKTVEKERDSKNTSETADGNKSATEQKSSSGVLVSPTGQTLKKIPVKALPPGVKPMPLPINARSMGGGEVCEMQIGKKVVKVQKIVMTKAEVEAMAKKGLLEMKDGTMVLKQGIKLPTADPAAFKTSLVGEDAGKESPSKKATPTRCDFGDDV